MIKIEQLIPFMKKGWVAMDANGEWNWFDKKPVKDKNFSQWLPNGNDYYYCSLICFDIPPADDWKKSLIKVDHKFDETEFNKGLLG